MARLPSYFTAAIAARLRIITEPLLLIAGCEFAVK
jgi:hypothetical protein